MGAFGDSGEGIKIEVTLEGEQATAQATKLGEEIEKLGEKAKKTGEEVDGLGKKTKETEDKSRSWTDVLNGMGGGLANVAKFSAVATGAITAIAGASTALILKLADAGNTLGDLEGAFKDLGGSSGSIQDASDRILGILPNIELYRIANQGLIAEIPMFNEKFAEIADYGVKVGDSLGISATAGIEKVMQAIQSGRAPLLQKVQLLGDVDKASRDYANSMGIVGRELTEAEKKIALQISALDKLGVENQKLGAHTDNVQTGLERIGATFTNQIGIIGKVVNENDDLTKALSDVNKEIQGIDLTELTENLVSLAGEMANLGVEAVKAGVSFVNDFARGLRIISELSAQTGKAIAPIIDAMGAYGRIVSGQIPSLQDLKTITGALGKVELPSFQKAAEKVNAEMTEQIKVTKESAEAHSKSNQQLAIKKKTLKDAGDEQDKFNKGVEAGKKAEEERLKALDASDKALKGLQKELRELNEDLKLEGLTKSLETAFKTEDFGTAGKLKDEIKDQVKQGLIQGYKEAGGVLNAESEGIIEQQATIEANKIYTSTKDGVDKGLKDGFLESEFPNYLSEMITGSLLDGFKNGFTPETLQGAGDSLSAVFAQSFQQSFQKMFSSEEGGGFAANWQGALTDLAISYGISSLTANATDKEKDVKGGIVSGAIAGAGIGTYILPGIGTAVGAVVGAGAGYLVGQAGPSTNADTKNRHETINFIEGLIDNRYLSFLQDAGNIIEGGPNRFNTSASGGFLEDIGQFYINGLSGNNPVGDATFGTVGEIDSLTNATPTQQGIIQGPDWANQYWSQFGQQGGEAFQGLGAAFSEMAGTMGPGMEQIGVILAENLGGNLDNARMLMQTLGIGAEQLEQSFMNIGLSGAESWHTVEVYMQSINDLTGEGLIGLADLDGAMQQFVNSGGRGQEALIALRNIAIEGMEASATSLADLRTKLEASGKYTVTQLDAIFGALDSRGITTLDGLRDASDRMLGGVTADAESLGFAWDENISEGMKDSIKDVKELKSVINELPDEVEKNIVLKVRTEYSGDDAKALYSDLSAGVAR
jgi:hypothetical protein